MRGELKKVIWEWLPGPIAGVLPLGVFLIVGQLVPEPTVPTGHPSLHIHSSGLMAHLLVFAIVTSSVSIFTSFPRLFARHGGQGFGPATLGLIVINTLVLVFSTSLYTLHEARSATGSLSYFAWSLFWLSMLASLAIEFAIANFRFARRDDHATAPESGRARETGA